MDNFKDKLKWGALYFILALLLSCKAKATQFNSKTFEEQIQNSTKPVISSFFNYADPDANFFIPKFEEFSKKYADEFKIIQTDIMQEKHPNKNITIKTFGQLKELCGDLLRKYKIRATISFNFICSNQKCMQESF